MLRELIVCAFVIALIGAVATAMPITVRDLWRRLEQRLSSLARHRTLSWIGLGALVLIVRLALLPVWPIPEPSIYDEFSYLLQADTFAHGRLTNPPHPLWRFFESPYILHQPTYASRFPPAQALALATGQLVFGHPWFGVWLSAGLLAASLCWALQGWLPPRWALLGAVIGLELCLFTYWMNSYWGGAVAAVGGALVTGAWVRITRAGQSRYAWHLGVGAVILVLARPFEGLVLLVPVLVALGIATRAARVWLPIVLVGLLGGSWLAYDNYRVTGDPLRLPYQLYTEQYEAVPPFWLQPLSTPQPNFRPLDLEVRTREAYSQARRWRLVIERTSAWLDILAGSLGNAMWLVVLAATMPSLWHSKRIRLAGVLMVAIGAASMMAVWWYAHYAAPVTAALLILVTQSMRYVRHWKYGGREIGRFLARATPVAVLLMMVASEARAIATHSTRAEQVQSENKLKRRLEKQLLDTRPGRHVVIVRYTGPSPHVEWVYNPADIDAAPVIWAHDMGTNDNERLRKYYAGRSFWLFKPDESFAFRPY